MAGKRANFICCSNPSFTKRWDMEHAAGLDFDLEQCSRCEKFTMTLWSPHGTPDEQTITVEVTDADAKELVALHERKMQGVRWLKLGQPRKANRFFYKFWNEHRQVLEAWLKRSGFVW